MKEGNNKIKYIAFGVFLCWFTMVFFYQYIKPFIFPYRTKEDLKPGDHVGIYRDSRYADHCCAQSSPFVLNTSRGRIEYILVYCDLYTWQTPVETKLVTKLASPGYPSPYCSEEFFADYPVKED